jgi:hypothetical protein
MTGAKARLAGRMARNKDEEDGALIRLADAVCGLVRAGLEGEPALMTLCQHGIEAGILSDVTQK